MLGLGLSLGLAPIQGVRYPQWLPRDDGGRAPAWFADYANTRFWGGGASRDVFANWLTAVSGTFTRSHSAGVAWFRGSNGLWQQGAANTLRLHYTTSGTLLGAMFEGAEQNELVQSRDLSNAAWTKSNATATKTATGIDGVANSASVVTATASNGYVAQVVTSASAVRRSHLWIKRRTGSGIVSVSQDGGATYTDVTSDVGASWNLIKLPAQTLTNPEMRIRLGASGDAVDVDFPKITVYVSSPFASGGARNTRERDALVIPASVSAECTIVVYGRTGLSLAGTDEVFAQIDDGSNNNRLFVFRNGSTGAMTATAVVSGSGVSSIVLGTVADDTDFAVAASFKNDDFAACLNGGTVSSDVSGAYPSGLTNFRTALSGFPANGVIKSKTLFTKKVSNYYLPLLSDTTTTAIVSAGDSYSSGASGVAMYLTIGTVTGRIVTNIGAGGATLAEQRAVITALPAGMKARTVVIWDGSPNGYGDVASYLAEYATIISSLGHSKYVIVPPIKRPSSSSQEKTDIDLILTGLQSAYAGHVVDAQARLAAGATSPGDDADVLAGVCPTSLLQGDGVHLAQAGMTLVVGSGAGTIAALLTALGA